MRAMLLHAIGDFDANPQPLTLAEMPVPEPAPGEILVRVSACGVCRTELDEIEGRTPPPRLPVVLGHQAVGQVARLGQAATRFKPGDRVGVGWIFSACGACDYCLRGDENLCPDFRATGRDAHGGYAEYLRVPEAFAYAVPPAFEDAQAAPLLCAGAIGYRSLRLSGVSEGQALGLAGFGASAHLVLQLARQHLPNLGVFVFARSPRQRAFALELGADWAGDIGQAPPTPLDAIIDTTPAWQPVVEALAMLRPGGRLVINAIGKEAADKRALLGLDYARHLWLEREIKSVANVTRRDVAEFLNLAAAIPIHPEYVEYPLEDANRALADMKRGQGRGARVLRIS
jgi:alcohol dehydrogenase, propanol-preferring